MSRTLSCRVCDFLEWSKLTWLSGPVWVFFGIMAVAGFIVFPLAVAWPIMAVMALAEAVRYAMCSSCALPASGGT